jgi:hypothetical protein
VRYPALSTEPAIPWVLLPYSHPGIVCLASSESLSSSTVVRRQWFGDGACTHGEPQRRPYEGMGHSEAHLTCKSDQMLQASEK